LKNDRQKSFDGQKGVGQIYDRRHDLKSTGSFGQKILRHLRSPIVCSFTVELPQMIFFFNFFFYKKSTGLLLPEALSYLTTLSFLTSILPTHYSQNLISPKFFVFSDIFLTLLNMAVLSSFINNIGLNVAPAAQSIVMPNVQPKLPVVHLEVLVAHPDILADHP
jgi:hypothetical protein